MVNMDLDLYSAKKIASSDLPIQCFAPVLFQDYPNSKFISKAGSKIEWYNPIF